MSAIKTDFGKGTLNSDAEPSIATALRDIADDLAGVRQGPVAAAAAAVTAVANATDLATALTLVNDLKAKYNAAVTLLNELGTDSGTESGYTIKTTKA